jgi:alpha-amylase
MNSYFGSIEDLKELSAELHRRGMYLMLDVIANHLAMPRWDRFDPTDGSFGVFNELDDFHEILWCRNYDDQEELEKCWLGETGEVALPDLNTYVRSCLFRLIMAKPSVTLRESPKVEAELLKIVRWLVEEFSVDGLRIDTVKHVRKDFWLKYEEASGVFCTGEVLHGGKTLKDASLNLCLLIIPLSWSDPSYTLPYQGEALTSVLNYPLFFPLR